MAALRAMALLLALSAALAVPQTGPELLVTTKTGKLQGFVEQGSRKWLGVPYAEPPVGDRRWRPPAPKKPWGAATRPATEFKPDCAQFGPGWPSLGVTNLNTTSEDCLTLNIFSPLGTTPGGAPVVVFFPAGGTHLRHVYRLPLAGFLWIFDAQECLEPAQATPGEPRMTPR